MRFYFVYSVHQKFDIEKKKEASTKHIMLKSKEVNSIFASVQHFKILSHKVVYKASEILMKFVLFSPETCVYTLMLSI